MNTHPPLPAHVLIAEDSPTQAERLIYVLKKNGYTVTTASNGRQALEMARTSKPTLLISDVLMPEMDGYQLCLAVKSDPELKRLPVILVTTLAEPQDVIRGLECRADNFIIKPYNEQYLLSRIQFVLLNYQIKQHDQSGMGIEIFFNDQRHFITADRLQILNLLLSTYEAVIHRNHELTRIKDELRTANASMESANKELASAVEAERRTHRELKSAQSQLVQAEKLAGLGQMVAGVAHEINNPLAYTMNNVFILQRDLSVLKEIFGLYRTQNGLIAHTEPQVFQAIRDLSEQSDIDYILNNIDECLTTSHDGLKRIEQIVRDLRDFARLDRGEFQDADLNAGIRSTTNIVNGRANHKGVEIHLELAPRLPAVPCNLAKINQVVMNLITNAIDASRPGGVVVVTTRNNTEEVQIEVADNGSGIDPSVRERLFDPFVTTKPLGQGVGLGLSISYSIVKDHHGRIDVDSAPDKGSTFTVHLPIQASK